MNIGPGPLDTLPGDLSMGQRIDQVCRSFEAAWRAGQRPTVQAFLGDAREPVRALLLRELIRLDAIYRRQSGETPRPADYSHCVGADATEWLSAVLDTHEVASIATAVPMAGQRSAPQVPEDPTLPSIPGYEVLGELGRGGMGVVLKARQQALGRIVAIKLILEGRLAAEHAVQWFKRGARAASVLDHPNIVPVYEIGEHGGNHFFTMAFVEGVNLKEMVRESGLPTPQRTATLVAAVADAMDYAHRRGVIHRDLKPDNVLVDREGRPRITDFGLAKQAGEEDANNLTGTGQPVGTPAYMAPEQALGERQVVGPAADVYGLGGVLYFLLTGHAPFQAGNVHELLAQVVQSPVVPPSHINPKASPELEAICLKCLEKDRSRRYPSAAAVAAALVPLAAPMARDVSVTAIMGASAAKAPPAPAKRWPRLALAGLLTGVVVLLGVGALLLYGPWGRKEALPSPEKAENKGSAQSEQRRIELPTALRHDFALKVEMLGGQLRPDGAIQLVEKQKVQFRVVADRDAYLTIFCTSPDGTITQLFPSKYDTDNRLLKNQPRTFPTSGKITATKEERGPEQVRLVASTESWEPVRGETVGPFQVFRKQSDQQALADQLSRGLVMEAADDRPKTAIAEAALRYRVVPRPSP